MKTFELIRKLTIYVFCLVGWGMIYYILLKVALNGGRHTFTMNEFEIWSELIVTPIILIILIIFIILEVKNESIFV